MDFIGPLLLGLIFITINSVLLICWLTTKKNIFGILIALFWLWYFISHNKTYGSFWSDFHKEQIVSEIKDSDLNKTMIRWQSGQENFFDIKNIADFASSNEWLLSDSLIGSYDSLKVFFDRFDTFKSFEKDYQYVIFKDNVFNHLEPGSDYRIYFFSTNIQAVSIATTDMTTKNGFVILSSNGKRLRVYHFWGEI